MPPWIFLDACNERSKITALQAASPPPTASKFDLLKATLEGSESRLVLDGELGAYLGSIVRVRDHPVPPGLHATLREYQVGLLFWLCRQALTRERIVPSAGMPHGCTVLQLRTA